MQKLPLSRPIVAACALALAGCSSVSNVLSGDKVDYRSGSTMRESTLDVPPDLTQLSRDSRYLPSGGSVSAASYQSARASSGATVTVAPNQLGTARIERAGNQRWLVVDMPPEQLWPKLRSFWQELGLTLTLDSPEAGVMETEWAENRAKLPNDIIRRTLGRVLDSLYSTGEVDRYRTRVERTAQGGSEIYISHRGMEEVYVDQRQEITRWQPRPADPELEAVMLTRLLTHLGQSPEQARTLHEQARQAPARARVVEQGGTIGVQIDDGFDRAWRRLGLSLDRSGFTVEDRDRARGLYFVRYVPPRPPQPEPGLLGRMFGRGNDETPSPQRYRIALQSEGDRSLVLVQNEQGEPDRSQTARRIVNLLAEDLR